jgi:hypothetical protein
VLFLPFAVYIHPIVTSFILLPLLC